jgi:hypothetical protein
MLATDYGIDGGLNWSTIGLDWSTIPEDKNSTTTKLHLTLIKSLLTPHIQVFMKSFSSQVPQYHLSAVV